MRLKIVPFLILPILYFSCKTEKDVMCTQEYRTITVSVKDAAAKPILLSMYYVKKTSTNEIIDFSMEDPLMDSLNRLQGIYTVFTDGKMGLTSKTGTEFEFHGIQDSTELVNERYLIGNDACHVTLLSGKIQIIISK
jgi:hypothetical protein